MNGDYIKINKSEKVISKTQSFLMLLENIVGRTK